MDGKQRYDSASPKARLFIDAYVGGATLWKAFKDAGYKGGRPAATAAGKRYQSAIDYRKGLLSKDAADRREQALARAELVAKANIADVFPDGLELSDEQWVALPREAKFLVESISVDRIKETVKLKLKPWAAAQAFLARVEGWEEPIKVEHKISPEGADAIRAGIAEEKKRRAEG